MLEAGAGEWQSCAIQAGLLFTPTQLQEVSASLPFQVSSRQDLVDWLMGMQMDVRSQASNATLVEKYNVIANTLNGVLQYIEVNLTAIRKIFKKFEKKVPAELRVQEAIDFKAHHELFMPS